MSVGNYPTVEIYVGIELSFDEVLITECDLFQLHCNFNEFFFACNFENLVSDSLDDFSSRVIAFIYSVSEAVEQLFSVLNVLNELRNILLLANGF